MGNTTPDQTSKSFRGWMGQAWAVALVLSVMVLVPPAATSEIYQALQPDGTLSVTNVPTDRRYQPLPFGTTSIGTRISQRELEQAIAWYARPSCERSSRPSRTSTPLPCLGRGHRG